MNADTELVIETLRACIEENERCYGYSDAIRIRKMKKLLKLLEEKQAGVFHRNDLQLEGFPYPVKELEGQVPCVLYFANQKECDGFQELVRAAKPEFTSFHI